MEHCVSGLRACHAERNLKLWGNPLWGRNVPGLLTWAAINAGLWVCFVWWLAGLTRLVWIIGASAYGGVILFHGIISIRPGYAAADALRIAACRSSHAHCFISALPRPSVSDATLACSAIGQRTFWADGRP